VTVGILRSVETKLEGLVEGAFNRAFRARVQPVELARRLAKEMESYKAVSVSRTYVPNEYIVFLSREDRRQFEGYEPALLDELAAHLLEHAARENLALLTRPKVSFETDKRLRMGEFGIQARLVKPPESAQDEASQGDLGATMVYSATKVRQAVAEPVAERPAARALISLGGKTFVLDKPRAVVGRSRRSDFVLEDPNVSRRHFELQQRGADWYAVDLESTNGIAVNGRRVPSAKLEPGDEITAGTSSMRFDID
jgi:FHA domain-containing protein